MFIKDCEMSQIASELILYLFESRKLRLIVYYILESLTILKAAEADVNNFL